MEKQERPRRRIVHIDMDAFFASVEELDNPELRGRPVVVGADPKQGKGRGVVSTCNYAARHFGIHSAMPISRAWKLCPEAVFLPPRLRRYKQLSSFVMQSLAAFSPIIEVVGLDEAYLDCTGTELLFSDDYTLARSIQERVRRFTGLSASVGIAPNKYIAKIASDLRKPAGISICPAGQEASFLSGLPLKRLWGAGKRSLAILQEAGFRTMGDLARGDASHLKRLLGKRGMQFQKLARGIDDRPVCPEQERKSISEELTFPEDISDQDYLENCLAIIADRIGHKLRREHFSFKCIQIKLRYENFETITRQTTLEDFSNLSWTIRQQALALFRSSKTEGRKIRLVGIGLSQLRHDSQKDVQLSLFAPEAIDPKLQIQKKRDALFDQLQNQYGDKLQSGRGPTRMV